MTCACAKSDCAAPWQGPGWRPRGTWRPRKCGSALQFADPTGRTQRPRHADLMLEAYAAHPHNIAKAELHKKFLRRFGGMLYPGQSSPTPQVLYGAPRSLACLPQIAVAVFGD